MIKKFSFLCAFILCIVTLSCLPGQEPQRDSFDDLFEYVDELPLADLDVSAAPATQITKQTVIDFIEILGGFNLLQENFFLRSNNLRSRSLLDYPEFLALRHDKDTHGIYVDVFYNQFSRMYFTKESSNICSYLAVTQKSFLATLEDIINNARALSDNVPATDEILRILDLFQTFTVQQRRIGLMIGGKTTINCWHLNVFAPWYYLERNHFVDQDIQDELEKLFEDILGAPTPDMRAIAEAKQKTFQDEHFISDKFGVGDTRMYLDYPVLKTPNWSTRLGFLATIPTAFAMKKGLKGSSFRRVQNPPTLDILETINALTQNTPISSTSATNYLLRALDNTSAILLDTPLGNGGHFGLGVTARNKSPMSAWFDQEWARHLMNRNFISLEYQFPRVQWRSFRIPVNEALFNARNLGDTSNQTIINENYDFILEQVNERFFPIALQTKVHPGFIFRWSSLTSYEGECMGFSVGTDTYVQNREKFGHINASPATLRMIDVVHAQSPLAYQSKVLGSLFFKVNKPDKLITITLMGDYTYMNKGIGDDFTLALNVYTAF